MQFYRNKSGQIFIKLNDETIIDGVIFLFNGFLVVIFKSKYLLCLVSGTPKARSHHSSRSAKASATKTATHNDRG